MGTEDFREITFTEYEAFLHNIEAWIKASTILDSNFNEDEIEKILIMSPEELKSLNNNELSRLAFQLYGYVDHLQKVYNREKYVLEFAEESIWSIISNSVNNYGDNWTKWPIKYYAAIRENPLASKLNILKNNVKCRVIALEGRIETTRRRAEILFEISRRF